MTAPQTMTRRYHVPERKRITLKSYRTTTDIDSIELGETVIYHKGRVAFDRVGCSEDSQAIDAVAHKFLLRSTVQINWAELCRQKMPDTAVTGTNELQLSQVKAAFGNYYYLAKRLRKA